jgi:hypothetical protein
VFALIVKIPVNGEASERARTSPLPNPDELEVDREDYEEDDGGHEHAPPIGVALPIGRESESPFPPLFFVVQRVVVSWLVIEFPILGSF